MVERPVFLGKPTCAETDGRGKTRRSGHPVVANADSGIMLASALTQTADSQGNLGVRFCGNGPGSLRLRAEDRARLAAIIEDRNRPLKHIQRAQIVLFSADRLPVLQVAQRTGV